MPRRFPYSVVIAAFFLCVPFTAWAGSDRTLETRFATLYYADDQEISDLLWRITGKRLGLTDSTELLKERVDELVERVEGLLEMYPSPLRFSIRLVPHTVAGPIARYTHRDRTIVVAVDRVTDGVLAHEMAHAVINAYFPVATPEKAQEVLAQYVDEHLWNLT